VRGSGDQLYAFHRSLLHDVSIELDAPAAYLRRRTLLPACPLDGLVLQKLWCYSESNPDSSVVRLMA